MVGGEFIKLNLDILRGINTTIWGGAEEAKKVATIIKSGTAGADVVIGTSHALEDFGCQDYVCGTFDVIGCVSTSVGLIVGNIPATKSLTVITGSITVGCRLVRYYCKNYGTYWGCAIVAGEGVKKGVKFILNNKLK